MFLASWLEAELPNQPKPELPLIPNKAGTIKPNKETPKNTQKGRKPNISILAHTLINFHTTSKAIPIISKKFIILIFIFNSKLAYHHFYLTALIVIFLLFNQSLQNKKQILLIIFQY